MSATLQSTTARSSTTMLTPDEREDNRRRRVVSGWRFNDDLGPRDRNQVRRWLRNEGPCPDYYRHINDAIGFGNPIKL